MPIHLSLDAEAKAGQIPDVVARLERFINELYELEQWRQRRANSQTAEIVEEAMKEGDALKASGIDRADLFARLRSLSMSLPHGT